VSLEYTAALEKALNLTVRMSLSYISRVKRGRKVWSLARASQTFDGSGLLVDGGH